MPPGRVGPPDPSKVCAAASVAIPGQPHLGMREPLSTENKQLLLLQLWEGALSLCDPGSGVQSSDSCNGDTLFCDGWRLSMVVL